ncbi:MAG TPA: plastocyanin/azurin family copper-binding protein [Solirubrobacterales bacterium]|jgi:plastocyanin
MKKAAVVLAMLIAMLALAACGGGGSTTVEETSGGAAAESEAGGEAKAGEEGGGEAEAEGGTAGTGAAVAIEANPEGQLAYEEKEVTAKAGNDTIDFTNQSSVPHNVTIENSAGEEIGETETLAEGSASAAVDLKPGTYTFFCSVPGHREAGMEGKLVVK